MQFKHANPEVAQLGIVALRRVEICRLLHDSGIEFNENTPKDELVKLTEGYRLQGKLKIPQPQKAVDPKDAELEAMKKELADAKAALQIVVDRPLLPPTQVEEPKEDVISGMSYHALQGLAKKVGINSYGKNTEELRELLSGNNVSD